MKNRNSFISVMPYVLLIVVSVLLTGISELATAHFDFTYLLTADYWANMILTNLSAFLMALATTLMVADYIANKKTEGLGKEATELEEAVRLGSANIENDVDLMIVEENLRRKKEAWIHKIKSKMIKVEEKFNSKDSIIFLKYTQLEDKELFDIKRATKRVKKKIKFENQISEEYIDKKIAYINVKYDKLTRRMIENGQMGNKEENTKLASSGIVLIKGILPKFLYSTSITILVLSFRYELAELNILALVPLFAKLITLILNANFGKNFAPTYFNDTTIFNLKLRKEWITKYFDWKKNKKETSK